MRTAIATFIMCGWAAGASAQLNQPIYPAYDGFVQNPDGSYTLSFRYFSHNAVPVTLPAGEHNSWTPGPVDRGQPVVFKPGDWRFQCVMVVDKGFDGKLKWTITYAGTTTGTSEHMLQSNWNLVEGAAELKKIDYANVPKGVCLNRPPVVRVLGSAGGRGSGGPPALAVSAAVGERFSLFGSVNDEGLPRNGRLTASWKVVNGPGTVTFENPNAARTRATFSAPGAYELELTGGDGEFTNTARVVVNVK